MAANDGRRALRLFFKFGLLVSLPLTGYLWAQIGTGPLTIAMTVVCAVMAIGAEVLASAADAKLSQLRSQADAEERSFAAQSSGRTEKISQMDRIVETLSNQNHDLRGKLVSMQSEVQRLQDEELQPPSQIPADAAATQDEQREPGGGEVTDISTLRTRR